MLNTRIGTPLGTTFGLPPAVNKPVKQKIKPSMVPREKPSGHNIIADYGGCGHWRLLWPSLLLSGYQSFQSFYGLFLQGPTC